MSETPNQWKQYLMRPSVYSSSHVFLPVQIYPSLWFGCFWLLCNCCMFCGYDRIWDSSTQISVRSELVRTGSKSWYETSDLRFGRTGVVEVWELKCSELQQHHTIPQHYEAIWYDELIGFAARFRFQIALVIWWLHGTNLLKCHIRQNRWWFDGLWKRQEQAKPPG